VRSLLLSGLALFATCAQAVETKISLIDSVNSIAQVGISLRVPVRSEGKFKSISGEIKTLSPQEMSVHLVLNVQGLKMDGPAWVQKATISEPYLDSAHFPQIEFQSQPFLSHYLITGGEIKGKLTLKGQVREIIFVVSPTACHRPGFTCPIIGKGQINRHDFGMNANRWTVRDEVRFSFQLKFIENE
jgi:polyisoprenoid-binding protein YceI